MPQETGPGSKNCKSLHLCCHLRHQASHKLDWKHFRLPSGVLSRDRSLGYGNSWGQSFITSWGGRLYSGGGVRNIFGDVLGGELKIKWPMGRGWGHIFCQVFGGGGGTDVFHWSFFSLKSQLLGMQPTRPPLYPSSVMWDFLNHWAILGIKYALFLLNKNLFLQMSPSSFSAFNNNHYHQC